MFLTGKQKIFYSGSNTGHSPAVKGRTPGLWDLKTNTFTPITGMKDPDTLETSSSVLLPPAQEMKVTVLGGGGVGESPAATSRTSIVDLDAERPAFSTGPRLPKRSTHRLTSTEDTGQTWPPTAVDQRSVALAISRRAGKTLTVREPDDASLVPPGWYTTAVPVDEQGVPSPAVWVTCPCDTKHRAGCKICSMQ